VVRGAGGVTPGFASAQMLAQSSSVALPSLRFTGPLNTCACACAGARPTAWPPLTSSSACRYTDSWPR
jgi:hypothetical protein